MPTFNKGVKEKLEKQTDHKSKRWINRVMLKKAREKGGDQEEWEGWKLNVLPKAVYWQKSFKTGIDHFVR